MTLAEYTALVLRITRGQEPTVALSRLQTVLFAVVLAGGEQAADAFRDAVAVHARRDRAIEAAAEAGHPPPARRP